MTPEEEEQVRRVLGSLPPEGPMPPAVVERLDATLAELVTEQRPVVETRPDELAARRRRRWRTGLVAAAAVAVVGVGLTTVVDDLTGSGGDTATQTAADSADTDNGQGGSGQPDAEQPGAEQSGSGENLVAPEAAPDAAGGSADSGIPAGVTLLSSTRVGLGSDTLAPDVEDLVTAAAEKGDAREGVTAESDGPGSAIDPCVSPAVVPGDAMAPVRFEGELATLVLGPPEAGTRVARVYSCDDGDTLLATTTVPAP